MRFIVLEDNSNSLRFWIYTLIITTYRINKRGFDCALSRATSRAVFSPIFYFSISFFPLFFASILPRLLALFFLFFILYPIRFRTTYLSHTSRLPVFLLHHYTTRFSWGLSPQKLIFVLLDSLAWPKISITIYLFICLTHAACCMPARKHPSHLWFLGE